MRASPRAMPFESSARDLSFRKRYDNGGSGVWMTYGLTYHAPTGASILLYLITGGLHHRLISERPFGSLCFCGLYYRLISERSFGSARLRFQLGRQNSPM